MRLPVLLVVCFLWLPFARGAELDAETVIARFIERSRANSNRLATARITFLRRTTAEQFDAKGALTERKVKEQEVELRGFEQSVRLLRVDGREVSARDHAREDEEESGQRRRYTTRSDRSRRSNVDYLDEKLIRRFAYTLEGSEEIEGRRTYRLRFEPLAQRDAKEIADRVLGLLTGHLWIDAEESELVKVDAHLSREFSFWGGVVGSLDRLDLELGRQRLADGTWVNSRLNTRVSGRKVFSRFHGRFEVEQQDFRPGTGTAVP